MRSCIVMRGTTKLGQFFTDKVPPQTSTLTVCDVEVNENALRFRLSRRMKLLKILHMLEKGDAVAWKDYEKLVRGVVDKIEITEDEEEEFLYIAEITLTQKCDGYKEEIAMWELAFTKTRTLDKNLVWKIELLRDKRLVFQETIPRWYTEGFAKINRLLYRDRQRHSYRVRDRRRILIMLLNLLPFLLHADDLKDILHDLLDDIISAKLPDEEATSDEGSIYESETE